MIKSYSYLGLAIVLWSMIPVVSTMAGRTMPIGVFLFYSNALSFLAVVPFVSLKTWRDNLNIRLLFKGALYGMIGVFGYYLLLYKAYNGRGDPLAVLLSQYMWPVMMVLFSAVLLRESLNTRKIIALILGFASLVLVQTHGLSQLPHSGGDLSILLALLAASLFALYSVLNKKIATNDPSLDVVLTFGFGWVYSAIYLWFFVPYGFVSLPFDSWRYIALNGVAINGVSYLFWIWSLKTIEGSKAGIYVLSVPVLSALWICLFLGAPFELSYFWALAALIVAGVLIVRA